MRLGHYFAASQNLAEEILDSISRDEIDAIYDELKKLGYDGWWGWRQKNRELISKFVAATLTQRANRKSFQPLMPLLAFAAYQHCLAGAGILEAIERRALFPGQSYRSMAAAAGDAYHDVGDFSDHELWPWDENPFERNA